MSYIYYIILAIGSVATLILWFLRKYYTIPKKVKRLEEQVDGITAKIIEHEKCSYNNRNPDYLYGLYTKRKLLNRKIRRLER
jgi:hypothetical protein